MRCCISANGAAVLAPDVVIRIEVCHSQVMLMLPLVSTLCPLIAMLQVPYYEYALDMILDNEPPADVMLTDQQHEMLENAAEMLYGLIHARYVVTARGLTAMLEKFKNCDFGRCPR